MGWITVGEYKDMGKDAQTEKKRWEDVAEDIGLIPDRNVRVVEDEKGVRIEVSEEMYGFFG